MESTNFDYSTKNIPIPPRMDYKRRLIEKTELLCRRMRWKALFYLNPDLKPKETVNYGFNSKRTPPQIPQMLNFESRLHRMIQNVKFKHTRCEFQQKLASDVKAIKKSDQLLIPADKTTNYYRMNTNAYNELLSKNVTKTYKKVKPAEISDIEKKTKTMVDRLNLSDRINTTAKKEAFVTLKDHKPNFANNPTCRLINPSKPEIGKLTKQVLDRINTKIKTALHLNQWGNTAAVLQWFNNIQNKNQHSFVEFDVVDFYPSISIELLNAALDFASNYDNITPDEKAMIIHAKKSLLFNNGEPWGKKSSPDLFDVTMGSYDGAETCELVGSFLLYQITEKHGTNFGLYRDDGLGITTKSPRQAEIMKKDLCAIFNKYGLKITIDVNKKIVNFLDVTLNLTTGKYMPYMKPNNTPLYIHKKSNHPPIITKNLPQSINKRLCDISSDEQSFNNAAPVYQKALEHSGYDHKLKYEPPTSPDSNGRKRKRNIVWYNPPYSSNVATNIGQTFLTILDEEFNEQHCLHKIFNRNSVKISYSSMSNIKHIIDGHNKAVTSKTNNEKENNTNGCNCRNRDNCPLSGECLAKSLVYQATVETNNNKPNETYVGLTANSFKTRLNNHKATFKDRQKRSSTELSKHIWELKDKNTDYSIKWKILKEAKHYDNTSKTCSLCLWEKYFIICKPSLATLNKRNELVSSCRHANKFLLKNFVT